MKIYTPLKELTNNHSILIIGLGNPERGEDGVGIEIARKLKELAQDRAFSEEDGLEEIILDTANNNRIDTVIFIDAVDFGGKVGEVRIFSPEYFSHNNISTHKIPINIISAFLTKNGKQVYLLGIQIDNSDYNAGFSSDVEKSIEEIYKVFQENFEDKKHK